VDGSNSPILKHFLISHISFLKLAESAL
jgi:hypothetical protein